MQRHVKLSPNPSRGTHYVAIREMIKIAKCEFAMNRYGLTLVTC
jgi:hypothetical protein